MRLTPNSASLIVAALLLGASAPPAPAPDFSNGATGWVTPIAGDYTPVPGLPSPVVHDPAHPFLNNVEALQRGVTPTYRIADLSNPNLKPAIKQAMQKDIDEVLAGKIAYSPSTSCEPSGVPAYLLQPTVLYFVQTPEQIIMINSYDSEVRHVFLNATHSANVKPSWYGESVGHYEGDSLVIDTIGVSRKSFVDAYRTPHSESLHVVERWSLADGGRTMQVLVTVDDPLTYYRPWSGILRYRQVRQPVQEAVCAENNQQFDYHMPTAKSPDF
ncbi:MAG TPA: hypothetical protein VFW28_18780 [Micropepsaceae bacterium]|nr:hypothetical protein [Micropepsaceae bacterium]